MPAKKAGPANLSAPIFTNEAKAREHLEALRWPEGAFCPHCGDVENVSRLDGEAHRPGLYQCNSCREQFSVTVGTLFERSHLPLHKWLLAFHLMAASKKGVSAHQLHRMLGITYKTAWFMGHRIREAMKTIHVGRIGGSGKTLEADETFWGQKPRKRGERKPHGGYQHKNVIVSLVERGGDVRSFHVPNATAGGVRRGVAGQAGKKKPFMNSRAKSEPAGGPEVRRQSTPKPTPKERDRRQAQTKTRRGLFRIPKS